MGSFRKILSVFLAAAMLAGGAVSSFAASDSVLVREIEEVAEDYNLPEEFLEEIEDRERLPLSEFWQTVANHNLSVEFMQRFTEDYYVYKKNNAYHFQAINPNIPHNSYDWSNLVRHEDSNEVRYVVDGENHGVKGIDVSSYQGDIDWAAVKASGIDFAMIRAGYRGATRGKLNEDSKFADNYTGAKDAGVKVGIYFFSQATSVTEAEEEAGYVLQLLQNKSVDYPVVFDWEQTSVDGSRTADATGEQITSYASAFCKKIAKAGYTAGVYFNRSLGYNYYDLEQLKDFEFWLAEYRSVPAFYYNFGLWQYSDNAQVQGIDAAVDINVSFKNYG